MEIDDVLEWERYVNLDFDFNEALSLEGINVNEQDYIYIEEQLVAEFLENEK